MLVEKKFKYVLAGRLNNDPIERRFSLVRCLSGNHLALDACTFAHNERSLSLHLVTTLCINPDGSHNKISYTSFFEKVHSIIESSEKIEVNNLKNKWKELDSLFCNNSICKEIISHQIIPYIAGYGLKKLFEKTPVNCFCCKNKLMCGINIDLQRKVLCLAILNAWN